MDFRVAMAVCVVLMVSSGAPGAPARIDPACRRVIAAQLGDWQTPKTSAEVAAWARQEGFNPVVADGDFDGNGRKDQAILMVSGGRLRVAVCFSDRQGVAVKIIERPYCGDYVVASPANSEHYNYETDATEKIIHDGISVGCFEKAGATYVYENGEFRRVVDSD